MISEEKPGVSQLLKFFIPLAFQAMATSLSYPLVAMVASRGEGGATNLAALAQSNTVMFLIFTISSGLITSGLVYAKTAYGYTQFKKAVMVFGLFGIFLHTALTIPYLSNILFGKVMGLRSDMLDFAIIAFRYSLIMQILFFIRIPDTTAMYNAKVTGRIAITTIARIGVTLILSYIFCEYDLVGVKWAMICMIIPLALEVAVSKILARPFRQALYKLNQKPSIPITVKEIIEFTIPLTLGGLFLSFTNMIIASIIARADNPEVILPVYYTVAGVIGPLTFITTRLQAVTVTFKSYFEENSYFILKFAVVISLILGFVPYIFLIPKLTIFYFVDIQKLNLSEIPMVKTTILFYYFLPLVIALRAYKEGLAAFYKKPVAVLTGNAVFLGITVAVAYVVQNLGVMGTLIGVFAIISGNLAAYGTMSMAMKWESKSELQIPIPSTNTSQTHLR